MYMRFTYKIKQKEGGNFLKQVHPETPYDPWTCLWLILWVGFQTAVLQGQAKYGARFWIPSQCLPPKYNYSCPIPPVILAKARLHHIQTTAAAAADEDAQAATSMTISLVETTGTVSNTAQDLYATSVTTRNRCHKRSRHGKSTNGNTVEGGGGGSSNNGGAPSSPTTTTYATTKTPGSPIAAAAGTNPSSTAASSTVGACLDCSICYETIDVVRQSYMLAPCDHLFHRDCLCQWMDVKMECPICRTELPAL
jgi:hypothetical protein